MPDVADVDDIDGVSRYSAKTFHCCVNCGRRFGSQARTWPEGWSSGTSSANPVTSVPAPVVGRRSLRLEEERRIQRQAQVGAGAFHVLGNAVAAADDPTFARAATRSRGAARIPSCRPCTARGFPAAVLRQNLPPGAQVEVRLPIVLLHDRLRVRPAQPEIQRELRPHLEVVLDVERDAVVEVRPRLGLSCRGPCLRPDRRGNRENAHLRERAAVVEDAEQAVVAGVETLLHVVEQLPAELQRVAALEPGQLFVDLDMSCRAYRSRSRRRRSPSSPLPQPIELRPAIGWPPAMPNAALPFPMPAQSIVLLTTAIWL